MGMKAFHLSPIPWTWRWYEYHPRDRASRKRTRHRNLEWITHCFNSQSD